MSPNPYSDVVRRLFTAPEHAGSVDGAVTAGVEDQGLRIQLFAIVDGALLERLAFRAWGCPHTLAACEAFCANFEGRPAAALAEFSASELMQSLAVPVEKTGRILVLEDAVRALGTAVRAHIERNQ